VCANGAQYGWHCCWWQVEIMPGTRLMTDAIVMPDGNILFINVLQLV